MFKFDGKVYNIFLSPRNTEYTRTYDQRSILQLNSSTYTYEIYAIEIDDTTISMKRWGVDEPTLCAYTHTDVISRSTFIRNCPRSPMQQYECHHWHSYLYKLYVAFNYDDCMKKGMNPVFESARHRNPVLSIVSLTTWPTAALKSPDPVPTSPIPYITDNDDFFDHPEIQTSLHELLLRRVSHLSSMNDKFDDLNLPHEFEVWATESCDFRNIDYEFASTVFEHLPRLLLQTIQHPISMMPPPLTRQHRNSTWMDEYRRLRTKHTSTIHVLTNYTSP